MPAPVLVGVHPDYLVDREEPDGGQAKAVHAATELVVHAGELLRIEHVPGHVQEPVLGHQAYPVAVESVQEGLAPGIERLTGVLLVETEYVVSDPFHLVQVADAHPRVHGLPFPVQVILVQVDVEEDDVPGIENGVGIPLHISVGAAFGLAVAIVPQELRPVREGVHQEETDVSAPEHLVEGIGPPVLIRLPAVEVVLRKLQRPVVVDDGEMSDRHVGVGAGQGLDEGRQRSGEELVVRVEYLDILAPGLRQGGVDRGTVVPVGLVDDPDAFRVGVPVGQGHLEGAVRAAVVHDDGLEGLLRPGGEKGVKAARQQRLHVVGRDDYRQQFTHIHEDAGLRLSL